MENPPLEYTKDARVVMLLAEQIARENGSPVITPEHVLLGLLRNPDSGAMRTFRILGIPLTTLRGQVEELIRQSAGASLPENQEIALSKDTRAVLHEAAGEARARRLSYMDTSLILLGMMLNALLPVSALLRQNGVRLETFRNTTRFETLEGSAPSRTLPQRIAPARPAAPQTKHRSTAGRLPVEISPVFISLVLFTAAVAALMYFSILPQGLGVFLLVVGGWVISLCLHEFGHALSAYLNGDLSVIMQGYLTLNPFRYTHWMLSILLPLLFLVAGGIALPGGAVYVNTAALRTPGKRSFVSASGPLMNLAFLLVLAVPFHFTRSGTSVGGSLEFWAGLSLLAFFQIVALVLNLLPIPGLDGFGILAPFLPENIQYAAQTFGRFGFLLLFALLWIDTPIRTAFWSVIMQAANVFGISPLMIDIGFSLFRFWDL
ncbi:MAG: hypothetical protein IT308_00620 [Anaerolineaceae bacterium]|nr:hypothetical protein [Anaerolineaceae bacterium]